MSEYKGFLAEAIRILGIKKLIRDILRAAGVITEKTVGSITLHLNQGNILRITQNIEVEVCDGKKEKAL